MVAIIDYDAGNIRSVEKAVRYLGKEVTVTSEPEEILAADRVILPGVGAFGDAMKRLHAMGLVEVIRQAADRGTPFLGICLGLQLLFQTSEESPGAAGLAALVIHLAGLESFGKAYTAPFTGSDAGALARVLLKRPNRANKFRSRHLAGWNRRRQR